MVSTSAAWTCHDKLISWCECFAVTQNPHVHIQPVCYRRYQGKSEQDNTVQAMVAIHYDQGCFFHARTWPKLGPCACLSFLLGFANAGGRPTEGRVKAAGISGEGEIA
jgi:hypothetical protein